MTRQQQRAQVLHALGFGEFVSGGASHFMSDSTMIRNAAPITAWPVIVSRPNVLENQSISRDAIQSIDGQRHRREVDDKAGGAAACEGCSSEGSPVSSCSTRQRAKPPRPERPDREINECAEQCEPRDEQRLPVPQDGVARNLAASAHGIDVLKPQSQWDEQDRQQRQRHRRRFGGPTHEQPPAAAGQMMEHHDRHRPQRDADTDEPREQICAQRVTPDQRTPRSSRSSRRSRRRSATVPSHRKSRGRGYEPGRLPRSPFSLHWDLRRARAAPRDPLDAELCPGLVRGGLQCADVGDDRPAIVRGDAIVVTEHRAIAVCGSRCRNAASGAFFRRSTWNVGGRMKPRCTTMPSPFPSRPWQTAQ